MPAGAVLHAVLDIVRRGGSNGVFIEDLREILGFTSRFQVYPRLAYLEGRKFVERLPGGIWKIRIEGLTQALDLPDEPLPSRDMATEEPLPSAKPIARTRSRSRSLNRDRERERNRSPIRDRGPYRNRSPIRDRGPYRNRSPIRDRDRDSYRNRNRSRSPYNNRYNQQRSDSVKGKSSQSGSKGEAAADSDVDLTRFIIDANENRYKSILHEYSQKRLLDPPTYTTDPDEVYGFISILNFDNRVFRSSPALKRKKLAEQNVAHIALYHYGEVDYLPEGCDPNLFDARVPPPPVYKQLEDGELSDAEDIKAGDDLSLKFAQHVSKKSMLQMYCQKKKIAMPKYSTIKFGGQFLCNLTVTDKEFGGDPEFTKKEAEESAALAALEGIGIVTDAAT